MSRQFDFNFWKSYDKYLRNNVSPKTAKDRMLYARKYHSILITEDAKELLTLNTEKRVHVMKSLASMSKYLGCYHTWKGIREKYQLKWSNNDGLSSFNNIFDSQKNLTSMITWLRNVCSNIPDDYGNVLVYCTLTGLRPNEACYSVRLIHNDLDDYINHQTFILEHFKYPEIFIRRTKKAYISVLTKGILEYGKNSGLYDYDTLKRIISKNNLQMNMSYCRKIFATFLRTSMIESEMIDLLQGRVPRSTFARHYFRPDVNNERIRVVLDSLMKKITL